MAKKKTSSEKVVALLKWLVTVVAALSPWFLPLLGLDLFPGYFGFSSTCGTTIFLMGFACALGLCRRMSQTRMRKFLWGSIAVFFTCLVGCFVATQGFAFHWQLDASWEPLVYVVWFSAYLLVFMSVAVVIVLAGYLIVGNDA